MRIAIAATLVTAGCSHPGATAIDGAVDATPPVVGARHVALTGCGYSYTAPFSIGGSVARLQIDTGSNALAVAAAGCATCMTDGVSPPYAPGPTAHDLHEPTAARYDTGEITWTGELYRDDIALADLPAVPLAFSAIMAETDFFDTTCGQPQGIAGFSPAPETIPGEITSYPRALAAAGATDAFAMRYCTAAGGGDLWLNGYDATAFAGDPRWVPMQQDEVYEVEVTDLAVAGVSIGMPAAAYGVALVDSGGPNLIVPPAAFTAITNALAASPAFTAKFGTGFLGTSACVLLPETPAALDAELPALTVQLGTLAVQLPATAGYLQVYAGTGGKTSYCAALYGVAGALDLGNTLLRAGVTIFDRTNSQLGFVPAPCATE